MNHLQTSIRFSYECWDIEELNETGERKEVELLCPGHCQSRYIVIFIGYSCGEDKVCFGNLK